MHFFLRCQFYNLIRVNLKSDLLNIDSSLPSVCDEMLLDKLLCGNKIILMCALKYIKDLPRFNNSLFEIACLRLELFYILFDDLYV